MFKSTLSTSDVSRIYKIRAPQSKVHMNTTKLGYAKNTKQLFDFSTVEDKMGSITSIRRLDYVDINTYTGTRIHKHPQLE